MDLGHLDRPGLGLKVDPARQNQVKSVFERNLHFFVEFGLDDLADRLIQPLATPPTLHVGFAQT